ncbi:MAG: hypothetical protein V1709_07720 [Planctomycetota bacterium]
MNNGNEQRLDSIKREMKQKQIIIIKEAVQLTFEKLEELEKQKNIIQNSIKILKHDLFDLKDGRLDRVLERQSLNEEVKSISVIAVTKIVVPNGQVQVNVSPWYEEYEFKILEGEPCKINNSMTKTHASGSYKLKDGTIRYL